MSTITLPNIRVSSDLTVKVRLKDSGVAIDWSTLNNVKASIYSDAQRALAGRCDVSIDAEDPTLLVCQYAANKPQYVGVNRIVVSAKYHGETKTYDKPAFSFVRWTGDQAGEQITIDDPDVDVEIDVEDVSSSILDEAIRAAFAGAERANDAADSLAGVEADVEAAEALRVAAEESRVEAEEDRVEAEAARVDEEAVRVSAEDARVVAENAREAAEDLREGAEDDRAAAETARETAEAARVAAEALRVSAEDSRESAEAARASQASTDHTTAASDHTQAAADHTQAVADHTTAASDHTQASSDHTQAAADHTTAAVDHTQAQADHAVMEGYDDRLDSVESEVSQLEAKVTDLDDAVMKDSTVTNKYAIVNVGGRYDSAGEYHSDASARGVKVVAVVPGASYKITTRLGSSLIPGVIYTSDQSVTIGQNITTVLGTEYPGTGTAQSIEDQPLTIPNGTTFIIAQSAHITYEGLEQCVMETISGRVSNVYTKSETDALLANKADGSDITTIEGQITNINNKIDALGNAVYGVKWSTTDFSDLGTRILNAVGKTATAAVGTTDGSSDFDSIWPWSGMKRCNIKTNANGAKIVTFEGETGFALDGSNGDVFVRIPKFKTDRYVKDGYEYITIGEGSVHPAFIEDGKELEEIFVGAFEASGDNTALYSKAGIIPANNMIGGAFLAAAKARGTQYTLYDMRTVDAVWRLMAVEFGCRNSNRIIGYGYADFIQPIDHEYYRAAVAAQASNTITCGNVNGASWARVFNTDFAPGNTITICDGEQKNIVAQRVITSVTANAGNPLVIQFDGDPIDITTTMFVGNGPAVCNYCESIGSGYKLSWHTGRTNRPVVASSGLAVETTNPCRYRWIENPVGSLWHFLPDVTFNDLQMYVCSSMKDYEFARHTSPYVPVGPVLPLQNSNGNKGDVNSVSTPNYWMTSLLNDIFVKGNSFGKSFDTVHDGTITSQKGYGGYYYLNTGTMCVVNGGGFDHLWRCNILTHRAQVSYSTFWYLYGARLMFKNI